MPVRDRRPEDERPLFKAVNEQRLMGPVGAGSADQEEKTGGAGQARTASRAGEAGQGHRGPVSRAFDRAEENNWVYPSVASAAREKGLLNRADEALDRLRARLGV